MPATFPRGTSRSCATSGSASPGRIPGSSRATCSRSSASGSTPPATASGSCCCSRRSRSSSDRHARWRRWLLILAPALLLSLPPSLLTMPPEYQLGWLGVWGALWLLLVCWAITTLPEAIRARLLARNDPTTGPSSARLRSPAPWLAIGLAAGSRSSPTSSDRGRPTTSPWRISIASKPVRCARRHATIRSRSGRSPASSRKTRRRHGSTDQWRRRGGGDDYDRTLRYQLTGPTVLLSREVRATRRRRSERGGLELGVLDADKNAWLNTAHYWSGQQAFGSRDLIVPFELKKPLRVSRSSRTGVRAARQPGPSAASGSGARDAEASADRLSRLVMRKQRTTSRPRSSSGREPFGAKQPAVSRAPAVLRAPAGRAPRIRAMDGRELDYAGSTGLECGRRLRPGHRRRAAMPRRGGGDRGRSDPAPR